jgi:hypothetical protein
MSTETTSGIDAKAYLSGWLNMVTGMTLADIKAIPDDKWNATYGGCSKPCGAMIADAVTNLKWVTAAVKGEESDAYSSMGAIAESYSDKAIAAAGLAEASADFGAALSEASDERLSSMVVAPWGQPAPVFTLAQVTVNHIWYHDGQLNFVQTLLGDEKVHWMA